MSEINWKPEPYYDHIPAEGKELEYDIHEAAAAQASGRHSEPRLIGGDSRQFDTPSGSYSETWGDFLGEFWQMIAWLVKMFFFVGLPFILLLEGCRVAVERLVLP